MTSETDNECYECSDYENNPCYIEHPTCEGCKYNQPNQLAHMDVGGCLYYVSDDESLVEADKFGQKTDSDSESNSESNSESKNKEEDNNSDIDADNESTVSDNETKDSVKDLIKKSKPIKRKISEILDDNSETNIIKKFR